MLHGWPADLEKGLQDRVTQALHGCKVLCQELQGRKGHCQSHSSRLWHCWSQVVP